MAPKRFPLELPAGMVAAGTTLQSEGRWFDGQLIRFLGKDKMPVGGWRRLVDADGVSLIPIDPQDETEGGGGSGGGGGGPGAGNGVGQGVVRGIIGWRRDGGGVTLAFGTVRPGGTQGLFILRGGSLFNITPEGADALEGGTVNTTGGDSASPPAELPPPFEHGDPFVIDTFSDGVDILLTARSGELGASWTQSGSSTMNAQVDDSPGGLEGEINTGTVTVVPSGVAPTADIYVSVDLLEIAGESGQGRFVLGIGTNLSFDAPRVYVTAEGNGDGTVTLELNDSDSLGIYTFNGEGAGFNLELQVKGTNVRVLVNGVVVLAAADIDADNTNRHVYILIDQVSDGYALLAGGTGVEAGSLL